MAKKQKTAEELRKEFFEREAKEYAKRVQPVVIKPETVAKTKDETEKTDEVEKADETEETGETTETEETDETKGE